MATRLPNASEMFGGDPAVCTGDPTPDSPHGNVKPGAVAKRHEQMVKAMTAATAEALSGGVMQVPTETGVPLIKSRKTYEREQNTSFNVFKGIADPAQARLADYLDGPSATALAKEFTLTNPVPTGLLAFDLEAPSKLLFPRSSPIRNSLPRLKGQGGSRRFKVINSITGSGTGSPTIQP